MRRDPPRYGEGLALPWFSTPCCPYPVFVVLVSVVGLVLGRQAAEGDIVSQVQSLVGRQGAVAAQAFVEGAQNTTHGVLATAFGLLMLLAPLDKGAWWPAHIPVGRDQRERGDCPNRRCQEK
jgi:hypothetical protein